jgi:hypothetical protein
VGLDADIGAALEDVYEELGEAVTVAPEGRALALTAVFDLGASEPVARGGRTTWQELADLHVRDSAGVLQFEEVVLRAKDGSRWTVRGRLPDAGAGETVYKLQREVEQRRGQF